MARTILGIGTRNFGRRQVHRRLGECPTCKMSGELLSHDTRQYLVVFGFPVLPLGGRRILDACPNCHAERELLLHDWQAERAAKLQGAESRLQEEGTADRAIEALLTCRAYHAKVELGRLGPAIADRFANDATVHAQLGDAWADLGQPKQAETAFRRALALRDDRATRLSLAYALVCQSRAAEAEPLIAPALNTPDEAAVEAAFLVIDGYQAEGEHTRALELLKKTQLAVPALARDADAKRLAALSTAHLADRKKLPKPHLYRDRGRQDASSNLAWWLPALGLPATLALIAIVLIVLSLVISQRRQVWLVNGLPIEYMALIGGKPYRLAPRTATAIRLPEGDVNVIVTTILPPADFTFTVDGTLWGRLIDDRTFIVNPDAAAVMMWQEATYVADAAKSVEPRTQLYTGVHFLVLRDLHFPFVALPEKITLNSPTATETRRGISLLADLHPSLVAMILAQHAETGVYRQALARLAWAQPDDPALLQLLQADLPLADLEPILASRLGDQPPRLDWHRAWQGIVERQQPDRDLLGEYRQRAKAAPDSGDAQYLVAVLLADHAEAETWLRRAIDAEQPSAAAYRELALRQLATGQFEAAHDTLLAARERFPDDERLADLRQQCLLARGEFTPLLAELAGEETTASDPVRLRVSLLARAGRSEEGRALIETEVAKLPAESADVAHWRASLLAELAYAGGDHDAYLRHAADAADFVDPFAYAVIRRDLPAATAVLAEWPSIPPREALLLYLLADQVADPSTEARWETFIAAIDAARAWPPCFVDALRRLSPDDVAWLRGAPMSIELKAILMTALGRRLPAEREACFTLARQLNFAPAFPRPFLASILDPEE